MDSEFTTLLYIIVGFIDAFFYIPLIITIFKNPKESIKSNNFASWLWWSFSGFIILIYMLTVIKDTPAVLITTLNFLSCFTIMLILTYFKRKYKNEK